MRETGDSLTTRPNWEAKRPCASASAVTIQRAITLSGHERQEGVIWPSFGHSPGRMKYPETRHSPVSVRMGTTVSVTVRPPAAAVR